MFDCLTVSGPCDWLSDRFSAGGKRNIRRGELVLWLDVGGEGEVIVPVETIVGRWEISFGLEEKCEPFFSKGSFASLVSSLRWRESIAFGSTDEDSFGTAGRANASSARASVTR